MTLPKLLALLALALPACAETPPPASPAVPAELKAPFTGFSSPHYRDGNAWLCLPGRDDACAKDLDATELLPDGSRVAVKETMSPGAEKVDCFYVYPTVDLSLSAANHQSFTDLTPMIHATFAQAARFRTACRLFVPLYRQATIGAYLRGPEVRDRYLDVAASDVMDAFVHYMGQWNGGRKVVLVGHSQGAQMVTRLLQRFFDDDPLMRERLLLALPVGGQLDVPTGALTGGTFAHLPICAHAGETGCVVGYRSFLGGGVTVDPVEGNYPPPGRQSVCVNPAELDAPASAPGAARPFSRTFFNVDDETRRRLRGVDSVTTPFVMLRNFYDGACMESPRHPGFRYLGVTEAHAPGDERVGPLDMGLRALRSKLGLHILDFQFAQGDLVDLVAHRAAALP